MTSVTISKVWYNELLGLVPMVNPYFYEECGIEKVEVDVNEPLFDAISKELGWML